MTDQFHTSLRVLDGLRTGPLGSCIDAFVAWLCEQGYSKFTVSYGLRILGGLSCWMQQQGLSVEDLDERTAADFLRERRRQYRVHLDDKPDLNLLLRYLRKSHVIPDRAVAVDGSEIGRIVREFENYLSKERRLSEASLYRSRQVVRQFLEERFGARPIILEKILQTDISHFVLGYTDRYSRASAKLMVSRLRSFFRFLHLRGYIGPELAGVVPKVANWQSTTLPNWIPPEDVELLLKSCDQSTNQGQRNYAILLLLARLGLRCGEVVNMTLDDIDWEAGEIRVGGKSRRLDRLPLPKDVGEALTRYLCQGRPRCTTRRVFVRLKAPLCGLAGHGAIYPIVQRALDRAGLHPPHKGPHTLRHSLATTMLRKGATLGEIGEILRHRDIDTTQIYAKVDLEALSKIAQPWPGGGK